METMHRVCRWDVMRRFCKRACEKPPLIIFTFHKNKSISIKRSILTLVHWVVKFLNSLCSLSSMKECFSYLKSDRDHLELKVSAGESSFYMKRKKFLRLLLLPTYQNFRLVYDSWKWFIPRGDVVFKSIAVSNC